MDELFIDYDRDNISTHSTCKQKIIRQQSIKVQWTRTHGIHNINACKTVANVVNYRFNHFCEERMSKESKEPSLDYIYM